jgi:alpha-tubulin suppressor-like RCC1 family protein
VAYCWGENGSGQLGDATTARAQLPVAVAGDLFFRTISVGGAHACAIDQRSVTWCWGRNDGGQLGAGTGAAAFASTPLQVQ